MDHYDDDKSFLKNIESEITDNYYSIACLNHKIFEKRSKADSLESNQVNPSSVSSSDSSSESSNIPRSNQTPTEFVHELESCSPMEIIPDDD